MDEHDVDVAEHDDPSRLQEKRRLACEAENVRRSEAMTASMRQWMR